MATDAKRKAELEEKLRDWVGADAGSCPAPDVVNGQMIRHWCAVMGDSNPVYQDAEAAKNSIHGGIVAPPAMMNAWTMPPFVPPWDDLAAEATDGEQELHQLFEQYGYTGVVGTDHDMEIRRYLRLGDEITASKVVEAISEEKPTPLGLGYFIDVRWIFRDQNDEEVGSLLFRTMRYQPAQEAMPVSSAAVSSVPTRLPPPKGHDNAWWWEGIDRGELLIQKCSACGVLRHPPRPMCGECQSLDWEPEASAGSGTVYSFTVLHHPQVPGYEYPLVVGLIELDEGTRIVANVVGCEPGELQIGLVVEAHIEKVEGGMKLPFFRPAR
ncbi:MAG: OB-fold domain-containing protein [Proteobacteria bacterium]|nr:OB-fold domain-containing protein [Pseudomonadota bacterium]